MGNGECTLGKEAQRALELRMIRGVGDVEVVEHPHCVAVRYAAGAVPGSVDVLPGFGCGCWSC